MTHESPRLFRKGLALCACAFFGVALCNAASGQPAAPSTDAIPKKVAPGAAPDNDLSKQRGNLSDKLNNADGVIRPKDNIDPGMQKPAPAAGATPVIPPPGGAQGFQPK